MADVEVSMEVLQRLSDGIHGIDDQAQAGLSEALGSVDVRDSRAVAAVLRGVVERGARASSKLAAQYYRGMSLLQTGQDFDADGAFGYDTVAADIALAGIYKQAGDDDEKLRRLIGGRVSYEINRAAKVSVWRNGQRDPRDVRYARVPTGPETCAWCLMTAGLGYWFMTAEAASHTHRGCDCQIVPSIGIHAVRIRGYDSTVYRDMWREANRLLHDGKVPHELSERVERLSQTRDGYRTDTNGALAVMRWKYNLK